ncbi:GxGYxYP domain-containing protein [Clostridium paridis]
MKRKRTLIILVILILMNSSSVLAFSNIPKYSLKNPKKPKYLYVLSQNDMTEAEQVMISTLQGLISTHSSRQIYTINSNQPDYNIWLDDLKDNYNVNYEMVANPWSMIDVFKDYIKGYVLYSKATPSDPSINNACTLAALKSSLAIDESIEDKIKDLGITTVIGDCRNTDKFWAYDNLWNKLKNHSLVIELSPAHSSALRDYAIMTKSLVFYEDDVNDFKLREKVFGSMDSNSICLGWGPDEYKNVNIASKYGVGMIAADWSYNLSVLSSFPSNPLNQKNQAVPTEANVHYVTFIMSDGDNQQWNLGSNYTSPKWYGSKFRGKFSMGWSMTPSLYYLAPTVLNKYYSSATSLDNFIVSPSGNSYIYPSKFPSNALDKYLEDLNSYMGKVDEKYIAVIDDWAFNKTSLWDKFTIKPNIEGIFYLNYSKHDDYKGKILWSHEKPIVSCRNLLWSGLEDETELINSVENSVKNGEIDINNESAYTFVYVHAWSKDMSNISNVVERLNKLPNVRIVTPDSFMKLIKQNVLQSKKNSNNCSFYFILPAVIDFIICFCARK